MEQAKLHPVAIANLSGFLWKTALELCHEACFFQLSDAHRPFLDLCHSALSDAKSKLHACCPSSALAPELNFLSFLNSPKKNSAEKEHKTFDADVSAAQITARCQLVRNPLSLSLTDIARR